MTASNGPSPSAAALPETTASEPSMDDILASIRRIIADDDALPLSRAARAAAAQPAPAEPPAQPASDAFLGLGQRLFRGGEAPPAAERVKPSAFRPPAPRPAAAASESGPAATRAPTLKLRDFAPPEPPGLRPSQPAAPVPAPEVFARPQSPLRPETLPRPQAPKAAEAVDPPTPITTTEIKFSAEPTRPPERPAAPSAVNRGVGGSGPVPTVEPVKSDRPENRPAVVTATMRESVAAKSGEEGGAQVVPLTSNVSHLAEARLKAPTLVVDPASTGRVALVAAAPEEAVVVATKSAAVSSAAPVAAKPVMAEAKQVEAEPVKAAPAKADAAKSVVAVAPTEPKLALPEKPAQAEKLAQAETSVPPEAPARRRVLAPQPAESRAAAEPLEAPLLSPATGARINASFEALAESMMLRDPDMIERLAREMLRPMLKSWLDDNLPVVVERLVRAEIERIARGRG